MRYMIERFTGESDYWAAIGSVSAASEADALTVASAEGLAETGDRYRATPPGVSLLVQIDQAQRRIGTLWADGDLAVCGLLAQTVRICSDDRQDLILVSAGLLGAHYVVRGSLYSTITLKGDK